MTKFEVGDKVRGEWRGKHEDTDGVLIAEGIVIEADTFFGGESYRVRHTNIIEDTCVHGEETEFGVWFVDELTKIEN